MIFRLILLIIVILTLSLRQNNHEKVKHAYSNRLVTCTCNYKIIVFIFYVTKLQSWETKKCTLMACMAINIFLICDSNQFFQLEILVHYKNLFHIFSNFDRARTLQLSLTRRTRKKILFLRKAHPQEASLVLFQIKVHGFM